VTAPERDPAAPTLVFLVGPPAVGKMTVGMELARRTGFRLFTNHHTVDLVVQFFPFGSPAYDRLVEEFRRRVMEEVAASDLPGLVFTFVRDFDDPSDDEVVADFGGLFAARGGRVVHAELQAPTDERLRRCATELRLAHKPSLRDVDRSRGWLRDADACYRMDSGDRFAGRDGYLRMDNTDLSPADAAERIITRFSLPRIAPAQSADTPDGSP
jgi:hypothetical protein